MTLVRAAARQHCPFSVELLGNRKRNLCLILCGPPCHCAEQVGWLFYTSFVRTMRREWLGIDRLRLDKFMVLIRKFFAATLRQLQAHDWWVGGGEAGNAERLQAGGRSCCSCTARR